MTETVRATEEAAPSSTGGASSALRIAVLDRDSGFIQVLSKRLDRLGLGASRARQPSPTDAVVSMRLSALVVDLAVLGTAGVGLARAPLRRRARAWHHRMHRPLHRCASVCGGCVWEPMTGSPSPAKPEEVIARVQSVVRRRRRSTSRAATKAVNAGELEIRSDRFQAFVGTQSIDLTRREFELIELLGRGRGPGARARGHLLEPVGLCDGSGRSIGRRIRTQASPEAGEVFAQVALHPHSLRYRLPLRRGAGGGRRSLLTAVDWNAAHPAGDQGKLAGSHQDRELAADAL